MTVVLDYLTGRVVWMGAGRKAETLDGFFAGMSAAQKQGIQAVAMDMWEPFIKAVRTHCPQAKIVFDLFHLVKAYGEVMDAVRRQEYKRGRPGPAERHQGQPLSAVEQSAESQAPTTHATQATAGPQRTTQHRVHPERPLERHLPLHAGARGPRRLWIIGAPWPGRSSSR